MGLQTIDYKLVYYSGDRKTGKLAVVSHQKGKQLVSAIETAEATGLEQHLKPIFLGMTSSHDVVLMDPATKTIAITNRFPADAFPAHIYPDPLSNCAWFMNDGDKASGNDSLNCGDTGSSVSVVRDPNDLSAQHLATICVGRGHHQAAFTFPTEALPDIPKMAAISNLQDGTVSLIGNDPDVTATYLKIVHTINLVELEKEKEMSVVSIPNNAFPHGLVYSQVTGLLYNLNNGYGTVAVIDITRGEIIRRFDYAGHSNGFITPDGKYIFGRGADRKSDANHVVAKLSVLDVVNEEILDTMNLPDIYISKYYFNPEGSKLYLTTGVSGNDKQKANLITNELLCFDLANMPKITTPARINLRSSGALEFAQQDNKTALVFSSDSLSGKLDVIDSETNAVIANVEVHPENKHSRIWMVPT